MLSVAALMGEAEARYSRIKSKLVVCLFVSYIEINYIHPPQVSSLSLQRVYRRQWVGP